MKFKAIYIDEFLKNKLFFYNEIPSAQNTDKKYYINVYEYYKNALSENKDNFIFVCLEDNSIISTSLYCYYKEENKFFILNVNTRKDYQNKKIATKLLKEGMNYFFNKTKETEIYLWVNQNNEIATHLYNKLGFKTTKYTPNKLKFYNNIKDDSIMVKSLK